jgi:hypothetical protein
MYGPVIAVAPNPVGERQTGEVEFLEGSSLIRSPRPSEPALQVKATQRGMCVALMSSSAAQTTFAPTCPAAHRIAMFFTNDLRSMKFIRLELSYDLDKCICGSGNYFEVSPSIIPVRSTVPGGTPATIDTGFALYFNNDHCPQTSGRNPPIAPTRVIAYLEISK